MDSLTNIELVTSALAEYKDSVTKLSNTLGELEANKGAFNEAWKSSHADTLIIEYAKLIKSLEEAYASLSSYQTKIERVVQEFAAFDTTIEYDSNS